MFRLDGLWKNRLEKLAKSFGDFSSKGGAGLLVILTVSTEELASFFLFECPCDETHYIYGLVWWSKFQSILLEILNTTLKPIYWARL